MVPTSSVTALMAGRERTTSIIESSTNSQVPITTTTVITMVLTGTGITPTTTPTSDMVIASPVSQMSTFAKGVSQSNETQYCLSGFFTSQIWSNVLKQSLSPRRSLLLLSVKCVDILRVS